MRHYLNTVLGIWTHVCQTMKIHTLGFYYFFYWLCYYSCPNFSPVAPLHPAPPYSLRPCPHHWSCPWVMCINSLATPFPVLYLTSPWLFCNYLLVLLNPFTSSPIPPHPSLIWRPSKCSPYPWFCLCFSCLLSLFC